MRVPEDVRRLAGGNVKRLRMDAGVTLAGIAVYRYDRELVLRSAVELEKLAWALNISRHVVGWYSNRRGCYV